MENESKKTIKLKLVCEFCKGERDVSNCRIFESDTGCYEIPLRYRFVCRNCGKDAQLQVVECETIKQERTL